VYGECEFVFASIKVITITGLIILGIVLDLGGGPNHDRIGFRYWKHPGPFVQYKGISGAKGQFLGWLAFFNLSALKIINNLQVGCNDPGSILLHWHRDRCYRRRRSQKSSFVPSILSHDLMNVTTSTGRNLPKAIKRVYIRILLFYIGGTLIIGLLVPSTDPGLNLEAKNAAASPFVIAYVMHIFSLIVRRLTLSFPRAPFS
jgi:yeast amino acid transporter